MTCCLEINPADGKVEEWDECLPDCPQEEVESVCIQEPEFPAFGDGITSMNYTTPYVKGSGIPLQEVRF